MILVVVGMIPQNIVLLACGSFNPITRAHLDMFQNANDGISKGTFNVVQNIISPVNDRYMKENLLKHEFRVRMCELAVSEYEALDPPQGSQKRVKISVDTTEAVSNRYLPTVDALNQIKANLNLEAGTRIYLLAGQDLVESFFDDKTWDPEDVRSILQDFGVSYFERNEKAKYNSPIDMKEALMSKIEFTQDIHLIALNEMSPISSTAIRQSVNVATSALASSTQSFEDAFVKKMNSAGCTGTTIPDFIMPSVLKYIRDENLYITPRNLTTVATGALVRELRGITNFQISSDLKGYNTNEIILAFISAFKEFDAFDAFDAFDENTQNLRIELNTRKVEQGGGGLSFGCWRRQPSGYIVCRPTDSAKWKAEFANILRRCVARFKKTSDETLSRKGMYPVKLVRRNAKTARVSLTKDAADDLTIALDHLHFVYCDSKAKKARADR